MRPRTAQSIRGPSRSLGDIIKLGYFQQIRQLISKGMDVECGDSYRRTPLILCALMEPEEWAISTAMTLIEHGVCVGRRDNFGRNALHYASIYERARLVKVLLGAIDFDLGQTDIDGNTPLHYAAMSGNAAVCQLLAQSFNRYRISTSSVNHRGRTSLQEAVVAGNAACARAIEFELTTDDQHGSVKDIRLAGGGVCRSNSSCFESQNGFPSTNDRKVARPVSASVLDRRHAHLSSTAANQGRALLSLRHRASSGLATRVHGRNSQNPLYTYGYRRDDDIIYCAPEDDFRNKLDYVCKLVNLPCDPQIWDHVSMLGSANQNSSCWPDTNSSRQTPKRETDWRLELEHLFKVYEHQCSLSWRAARKCEKPPQTLDPSPSPEDDDKGKKGRSLNNFSRSAHGKENSPDLKKRPPSVRQRKTLNGKLPVGISGDGSLDTSSESISSGVSSKRRGPERESSAGRPESATSKLRSRSFKEPQISTSVMSSPLRPDSSSVTGQSPGTDNSASKVLDVKENPLSPGDHVPSAEKGTSQIPNVKGTLLSVKSGSNSVFPHQSASTGLASSPPAPSSETHRLTFPAAEIVPVTSKSYEGNNGSQSAGSIATKLPRITIVADKLEARDNPDSQQQHVDTNRLWVQNPYDENGGGDDVEDEENSGS